MKRSNYIVAGIVFIFILLGIWVYLIFFNDPKVQIDNDLSFPDSENIQALPEPEPVVNRATVDTLGNEKLRQLTSKPTAGYREIYNDDSKDSLVFWIEAGVGHIYSIDLNTGEESRVSGVTLPNTKSGVITPDGKNFMIMQGSGLNSKLVVGSINTEGKTASEPKLIDGFITSFTATTDNTFLYTTQTSGSLTAREYLPDSNTSESIFTIPFIEATIDWGETAEDTHFFYPKTTSRLMGFLYKATGKTISRVAIEGKGLSVKSNEFSSLYSTTNNNEYRSFVYNSENKSSSPLPLTVLPEKCLTKNQDINTFICAKEIADLKNGQPDLWYKGVSVFSDILWEINTEDSTATILIIPEVEVGRLLDITNITSNQSNTHIYLLNKNDQTLWLYDKTVD